MNTTGHIRIGETAVWRACPRCRRHTLVARVDGIITRCDPENLTITGELAARITGRLTFNIHADGFPPRMRILHRYLRGYALPADIRSSPSTTAEKN